MGVLARRIYRHPEHTVVVAIHIKTPFCYTFGMAADEQNQKAGRTENGQREQELQASVERMKTFLTDALLAYVKTRCKEVGRPFVDPVYYYIFMQEWARMNKETAESVVKQCEEAQEPENMAVASSVYESILRRYADKVTQLHAIFSQSQAPGGETLPRLDEALLQEADLALADFITAYPLNEFAEKCATAEQQRLLLSQNIGILKRHVWPRIEAAAHPLRQAGTYVLKVISDEIKKKGAS